MLRNNGSHLPITTGSAFGDLRASPTGVHASAVGRLRCYSDCDQAAGVLAGVLAAAVGLIAAWEGRSLIAYAYPGWHPGHLQGLHVRRQALVGIR